MSRPIKETPVLRGKDAERFFKRMDEANRGVHKVSKEEYEKSLKIYEAVKKNATF